MVLALLLLLLIIFYVNCDLSIESISPLFTSSREDLRKCGRPKVTYIKSKQYYLITFCCIGDPKGERRRIYGQIISSSSMELIGDVFMLLEDYYGYSRWEPALIMIDYDRLFMAYCDAHSYKGMYCEIYGQFFNIKKNKIVADGHPFKISKRYTTIGGGRGYISVARINKINFAVVYKSSYDMGVRIIDSHQKMMIGEVELYSKRGSERTSAESLYNQNGIIVSAANLNSRHISIDSNIMKFELSESCLKFVHPESIKLGYDQIFPKIYYSLTRVINTDNDYIVLWRRLSSTFSYQFLNQNGTFIGEQQDIVDNSISTSQKNSVFGLSRLRENVIILVYSNGIEIKGVVIDKDNVVLNSPFIIRNGSAPYVTTMSKTKFIVSWEDKYLMRSQIFSYELQGYEYIDYYEKYYGDSIPAHKEYILYIWNHIKYYLLLYVAVVLIVDVFILLIINNIEKDDRYGMYKSKVILNEQFGEVEWEMCKPFSFLAYYFVEPMIAFSMFQSYFMKDKHKCEVILIFIFCSIMYIFYPVTLLVFYLLSLYRGLLDIPRFGTKEGCKSGICSILFDIQLGLLLCIVLVFSYILFPLCVIAVFFKNLLCYRCIKKRMKRRRKSRDEMNQQKIGSSLIDPSRSEEDGRYQSNASARNRQRSPIRTNSNRGERNKPRSPIRTNSNRGERNRPRSPIRTSSNRGERNRPRSPIRTNSNRGERNRPRSPTRRPVSPERRSPQRKPPGFRPKGPPRRGRGRGSGRSMSNDGRRSPTRRLPSPKRRLPSPKRRLPSPNRRLPSPKKNSKPFRTKSPTRNLRIN